MLFILGFVSDITYRFCSKPKNSFRGFLIILLQNISLSKSFLKALTIFLATYQSQRKYSRLVLQKKKKTHYGPFSWMDFNCLKAKKSLRGQFTCHHLVPSSTWNSFHKSPKDGRLSQPWSHWVVLNLGFLDWQSTVLTTRPLLPLQIQRFYIKTLIICLAKLWDPTSFQDS